MLESIGLTYNWSRAETLTQSRFELMENRELESLTSAVRSQRSTN